MAIPFLNIINISLRASFRKIWQFLNLTYLYHLLYPYIAADFRHQKDCIACVALIKAHTHMVKCGKCGALITTKPITPIHVTPAIGLAQINVDPLTKLPAKIGVMPTVQPFDATSVLGLMKANIGIETNWFPELEEVVDTAEKVQKASKFFSLT